MAYMVMITMFQEEPALLKKWLHFLEKHPQVRFVCYSALFFFKIHSSQPPFKKNGKSPFSGTPCSEKSPLGLHKKHFLIGINVTDYDYDYGNW